MTEHNLFYFPYASFTDAQLPLLKVAAQYFDRLTILDPSDASWATIGVGAEVRRAVKELQGAGILTTVTPAEVLTRYEGWIAEAIRQDMQDPEFLALCDAHAKASGRQRWTLALSKVPRDVSADGAMRTLLGDFARRVAAESGQSQSMSGRDPSEYYEYAEAGQAYDEYRETEEGAKEYRYADLPLALGESIMINHALFAGLVHASATPVSDDRFHSEVLALKLRRARAHPAIRRVLDDRVRARRLKADALATAALTDSQIELPILSVEMPLEEVLAYRAEHGAELRQAREKLSWMARRIEAEPWSPEFARELERETIPDVASGLEEARRARDAWLQSNRGRLALKAAGVAVGAATAVLAIVAAPLTPLALATAGLGLASGAAIPGAEWLLDWREGKRAAHENGLHYLLMA
jgi:hypothetical protein